MSTSTDADTDNAPSSPQSSSHPPRIRILLLTNEERGQANVFLAVASALLKQDATVDLHLASFTSLQPEVASLSTHAARPIHFHALQGSSMTDGVRQHLQRKGIPLQHADGFLPASFAAPLGLRNTLHAIRDTIPIFLPYDPPELVEVYGSVVDTIRDVAPDLVVVDSLMTAGLTAAYHLQVNTVCLSPNAIKDLALPSQPHGVSLWKFPALFSGFRYPVPFYLWPLNVFYVLYMVKAWLSDDHRKQVATHLLESTGATLKTTLDLYQEGNLGFTTLVGTWPALDFPLVIPEHILPCGPIVRKNMSVIDKDSGLFTWFARAPTIYINLGSLCKVSEEQALEMAQALQTVLTSIDQDVLNPASQSLQVLWKLKKLANYDDLTPGSSLHSTLGKYAEQDRIRIVKWIDADPFSLLESGNDACVVHHGGANSFHEAILAGIPQVVLPQWTDCYDFAERVQLLGVGTQGNRENQPRWNAQELSKALLHVITGPAADGMRERAKHFATVCRDKGDGAGNAAEFLLDRCAVAAKTAEE